MAGGRELPWSCMSWKGLDAERIARLDREQRELIDQKNRGGSSFTFFHRLRTTRVTLSSGAPILISLGGEWGVREGNWRRKSLGDQGLA